ncbi:hypothetical protein [Massilia sp. TSP1-1-2]|uniref:hypothetical protein n=1 Tax=unclassified Massilia TaxID=2609279 RepID=UPI003CEA7213
MNLLKPVLLSALAASALFANGAAATERPPRVGEERIVPKKPADGKPAPAKKPAQRRAVRQVLDDDVRPAPPPAVYAPQLTSPPSSLPVPGVAPGPLNLNCVGATCTDANGGRFNGGVGTTLISPQGKLCNNNGMTVQCF